MKVTDHTRRALAFRREKRTLMALGYQQHATDWEIHRGWKHIYNHVIVDAKISVDGMYVYTRTAPK